MGFLRVFCVVFYFFRGFLVCRGRLRVVERTKRESFRGFFWWGLCFSFSKGCMGIYRVDWVDF